MSWAVETVSSNLAMFVTVVYWTGVHPYVLHYKLLRDDTDRVLNVFNHSFNTVLSVLDLVISARPVSVFHVYLPMIYGVLYSLFSYIYWHLGGEGICSPRLSEPQLNSSSTVTGPEGSRRCAPIIYPMLDWDQKPGIAVVTTCCGCVAVLVFSSIYYGVYRLRLIFYRKFIRIENSDIHIDTRV